MKRFRLYRQLCSALPLALTLMAPGHTFAEDVPYLRNGRAGFVVSDFTYAFAKDAAVTGACPAGMSKNIVEIYARTAAGRQHKGESKADYGARLQREAWALGTSADGRNFCMHPEAAAPDPYYQTVKGNGLEALGIDLDGTVSSNDFSNGRGDGGIDNQFYRVVGCNRSYQSSGLSNGFAIEMLSGSWGILISLDHVDDLQNDDDVDVGLYANADPIDVDANRKPLAYATYAMDRDPRFRATTKGKIRNGVLTTEPVDVRFHNIVNSLRLERPLQDARIQATLSADGTISGYLAGYTPVEAMYDLQFGFRNGKDGSGKPALQLASKSANGAAFVLGYTCQGAYQALLRYADGHPDPESGRYTSISTQYHFKAIPAFVVDVETHSRNADLAAGRAPEHGN